MKFKSGAPYLVPFLVASAAAAAAWYWRAELLNAEPAAVLQSPESQIRQALAAQGRAHLEDVYGWKAGGTLELVPVRYAEVVPDVAPDRQRASVVAMLDAEGKAVWRDQAATVSYIGREQFHMKPCKIALWCAEGDQFARLRAVLRTLFRRLDAARGGDPGAAITLVADGPRATESADAGLERRLRTEYARPRPDLRVTAWQIRVERDVAEVGEDYTDVERVNGGSRDVRHRVVYRLERRGERWAFVSGL